MPLVSSISLPDSDVQLPVYVVNESSIVDLTSSVTANGISFSAPGGNNTWRICSFWEAFTNQKSCTGGVNATTLIGNGSWTVDHFSATGAKVTTDFLDQQILSDSNIKALLQEVGEYGESRNIYDLEAC